MKLTTSTAATYAAMLARLLPRGPIWDRLNAALGGLLTALGTELNAVHARQVDLMEEAYPDTADELLDDWLRVWGLPAPCSTMPATADGKRELLAGKVAAQGGQSRAYFIALGRTVLGEPAAVVTVEELPDGSPFRVSENRVGDRLVGVGSVFRWVLHMPPYTTETQRDAIECLVDKYEPAHTDGSVEYDSAADVVDYYLTPGGAGDYAEASTDVAADLLFPGTGDLGSFTVLMWARQDTANGFNMWSSGTSGADLIESVAVGRENQEVYLKDAGVTQVGELIVSADDDSWHLFAWSNDTGGDMIGHYDGVEAFATPEIGNYATAQTEFVLFASGGSTPAVAPEAGALRNIAIFDRQLSTAEIAALYAAGQTHDYRSAAGVNWTGETPPVYWRGAAVGGVVANIGDGGTCNLILNGDVSNEVDP